MWGLKQYIKPYWIFVLLGPLFMLGEVFFDLLQPRLAAKIVNEGVVDRNFQMIEHTGLLMVLVAFLSLITGVACNLFASRASQNFGADIREALFTKIQSFSFETMNTYASGSLLTRMTNDVIQVQNLMQVLLQGLVRSPSLLIGSVVMAMLINVKLGMILFGTLIVLVVVVVLLIKSSYPLFSKVQMKLDAVNTKVQENLAGIRVVKAFVRSDFEKKQFEKVNRDYTEISIKAARFIAINSPIVSLIMNICLIAILLYGGDLVWAGTIQVGDLVAFINYVVQVLSALLMVSALFINITQANVSARRIQEVLSTVPTMTAESEKELSVKAQHVKFNSVLFSYSGNKESNDVALKDIDFEARRGQTIAIIGSTGAGKSTLVHLIPRLYDATSGSVEIDGVDVRKLPLLELRKKIGMVLQESILFTGTIRDNIAFGKSDATQMEVEEAARMAQAHAFITHLPDGYDTMVGQKGVNLSGGQKQRISIARALLVNPPILIMDDSTSALDLETEKHLRIALEKEKKEKITFLIAQRITSVMTADLILVMENGEIVGSGTHDELTKTSEVYQAIYLSQFGKKEMSYGWKQTISSE
ncbi:ABC transporter ATP-binding protein [Bacillus sp. B1-b2]|uniref:ABC transporter ATP-binding protein n=1 Tax=Bacillus sp. B1-b2 TaxID=2653201 RepID=UPI001261C983|nr:ABC transporter ATP-binding protein [Bacillus sp. B1-b2]KAB7667637.1 ABC transporter ATP-binding protein [Bacillus sp. B1-b2]